MKTTIGIAKCRFCDRRLKHSFVDLGSSPLANSYLSAEGLHQMEPFFPLNVYVCKSCYLVQLAVFQSSEEIFSDYAYFFSYSDSWLSHASDYTDLMVEKFGFSSVHQVIEIASNDGYLLQYFKQKGIPVLGIEPAGNVAEAAKKKGIPTRIEFFSESLAKELAVQGAHADLLIGNNVLAHVPDLNDFVKGMKIILKPHGVITMEFPHLMQLMNENQFDTIYHEHFSYFSFLAAKKVFAKHGLDIFDVEELSTHGGSLRIYACHVGAEVRPSSSRAKELVNREKTAGFNSLDHYLQFKEDVKHAKRNILEFLIQCKREGESIAGYGAPAKGNTLLNYCGIRTDFIEYTVDRSPHKQGHFLPGSRIPIHHPDKIKETQPDFLIILPWNLQEEIIEQMSHIRDWGGKFVTLIPNVRVHP